MGGNRLHLGIPAAPSSLGQGQQHLPLEGPFFMQKYLHIEKKMEEKSTFCSQPFSIPLPAPGEVWIFNSDDLNCIINCCSIPRSDWAAGLIYSQGGWAAEPVVCCMRALKSQAVSQGSEKPQLTLGSRPRHGGDTYRRKFYCYL